ncbi:hypothetical protein ACFFLM_25540 [Deinococcus oregonensis]|uniref:Uncharacterized protein n=1 Tax=Deinococcus oregonensis TaxID=1805970 RepID=A0ABV6BA82_9DEIO
MARGDVNLKFIRALICLLVAGCPLFVWLIWILGSELVRSVTQQDWVWTAIWTAVAVIMACGLWRVVQEAWALWQESRSL